MRGIIAFVLTLIIWIPLLPVVTLGFILGLIVGAFKLGWNATDSFARTMADWLGA